MNLDCAGTDKHSTRKCRVFWVNSPLPQHATEGKFCLIYHLCVNEGVSAKVRAAEQETLRNFNLFLLGFESKENSFKVKNVLKRSSHEQVSID